jgi:hypothetical protein
LIQVTQEAGHPPRASMVGRLGVGLSSFRLLPFIETHSRFAVLRTASGVRPVCLTIAVRSIVLASSISSRSAASEFGYGRLGAAMLPLMIVLAISVHALDMPVQRLHDANACRPTFQSYQKEQPPQGGSASRIGHSTLKPQPRSQHFNVGHQFRSVANFIGSSPSLLSESPA